MLGVLLGPALAWLSQGWALAYAGFLALYTTIVVAVSLSMAARPGGLRLLPWLPLVFFAVHAGSGWGILREAVAGIWPQSRVVPIRVPR